MASRIARGCETILSPAIVNPAFSGQVVKLALAERCGFNRDGLENVGDFQHRVHTDAGPLRIHLLRGSAMSELLLLREVFNLIVGAGGG